MTEVVNRAPYGRHSVAELGSVPPDTATPTYYDLPAVKRSHYGWLIATYFFVGGMAGAAEFIAEIADLFGGRRDRHVVRWGRYLAVLGATLSPILLIRDLHTSSRFYNMLRIFRPTSPMSIGSWTLAMFGTFSGLAALAQAIADLSRDGRGRGVARTVGVPAALSGMVMSMYTGVLLSATSTPLWAAGYRQLPALFGATATASATAALSVILMVIGAPKSVLHRLDRLALLCGGAQLVAGILLDRAWEQHGVAAPMQTPKRRMIALVGTAAPLLIHAAYNITGRRLRPLAVVAALATLVSAFAERAQIVFAGNESADRPRDYFRLTR